MPPIRKFKKEDIIDAACKIVEKEGFKSINARRIAKELSSSVQPIFHNFETMEELNQEIYIRIYDKYKEYMTKAKNEEQPYKKIGLAYINFAKDYPEFFKAIFMQKTDFNAEDFIMVNDNMGDDIIKAGQVMSNLSYDEQKLFHIKVWMFTHGIACLIATDTIKFAEKEIENLLGSTVREMLIGFKGGKKIE